jgi:hypothetical protein
MVVVSISDQPPPDIGTVEALTHRRRLSDKILVAFHHACDDRNLEIADQLVKTFECLLSKGFTNPAQDRRKAVETLVGAHKRLWHLKQVAATDTPAAGI